MKLHGNDIMFFFQQDGEWKLLAYGKYCEINMEVHLLGTASRQSGRWREYKKKRISWQGNANGLLCMGIAAEEIRVDNLKEVRVIISAVSRINNIIEVNKQMGITGNALITSVKITGRKKDMTVLQIDFVGTNGSWTNYSDWILASHYWNMSGIWYMNEKWNM